MLPSVGRQRPLDGQVRVLAAAEGALEALLQLRNVIAVHHPDRGGKPGIGSAIHDVLGIGSAIHDVLGIGSHNHNVLGIGPGTSDGQNRHSQQCRRLV